MKLYVWESPYDVKWGDCALFVIAETEMMAREQAHNTFVSRYGGAPNAGVLQLDALGPCSWSRELPFAFSYEWTE